MRKRAFTLIELLVVIGILSLLVSIMFPSLSKARDYAKLIMCRTNLKGIGLGWKMYNDEYPGKIPIALTLPNVTDLEYPSIMTVMAAQVPESNIWECPSDDMRYFEDYGTSYEYYLGFFAPMLENPFTGSEMARTAWQLLEENPTISTIIGDAEGFHPTSADPLNRQCMYHDGHVDYIPEDFEDYGDRL